MTCHRRQLAGTSLLLAAILCLPEVSTGSEDTASRWHRTLVENQRRLEAAEWQAAYPIARHLVDELVAALKDGESSAELMAAAYCQRALAEAALGREEDATWSFIVAQNLNPAFREASLAHFGSAGRVLEAVRRSTNDRDVLPLDREDLLPPLVLESPTIVFRAAPEILASFDHAMTVEVVVDERGRPQAPVVHGALDNPSPVALSLEALRSWRFEPATLAGEPIAARIVLDMPLTRGAANRARESLAALHAARHQP